MRFWLIVAIVSTILAGGCRRQTAQVVDPVQPAQLATMSWNELTQRARGTTVNFAMWSGDEARNRYFREAVAGEVQRRLGIELRIVPLSDAADAVNKLLNERLAGRLTGGSIDMIWINGENFRTARQGQVLWGPFAEHLPGLRFYAESARNRDFGTLIEGYEAPWQRAQFVLAYDSKRVAAPPRTIADLRDWIRSHPGRFTYPAPPDFTGSAFIRHLLCHFGGGAEKFENGFDEQLYQQAAEATMAWLNDTRPFLWRRGETYPSSPQEAERLFVNNEIDFVMSYAPSFASEKIARGDFPQSVRTFVFESGTIGNYSYLAIPFNAANTAGALVTIDYLMSPEALLDQARALGIVFPHEPGRLSPEDQSRVGNLPRGPATLTAEELARHLLPEADSRYLERLEKDWRERVLQR